MFTGNSWSDFILFIGLLTAAYYTVVYLVFYFPYKSEKNKVKDLHNQNTDFQVIEQDSILEDNPFITSLDKKTLLEENSNINITNNTNNIDIFEEENINKLVSNKNEENSGSIGSLIEQMKESVTIQEFDLDEDQYPIPSESETLEDYSFMNESEEEEQGEEAELFPVEEKTEAMNTQEEDSPDLYITNIEDDFNFSFTEVTLNESITEQEGSEMDKEVSEPLESNDLDDDDVFDFNKN